MTDQTPDELTLLKQRAKLMGIKHHPSIGLDKLKAKISAIQKGEPDHIITDDEPDVDIDDEFLSPDGVKAKPESKQARKQRLILEATKLVRVNVTCMNPNKREHDGEIFCVGNSVVGMHRKYVPFNTDQGWHIPQIIYDMLKMKQCQVFSDVKLPNGQSRREGKLIREFAIDVLPSLTQKDINKLALQQAKAAGTSD